MPVMCTWLPPEPTPLAPHRLGVWLLWPRDPGALITLNSAIGGSGGGQGIGGGLYVAAGTVTLSNKTKVVGIFASTSNDNIFGLYTSS